MSSYQKPGLQSVAHFMLDVIFEIFLTYLNIQELLTNFNGHKYCFLETGYSKSMLLDFNYNDRLRPGNFLSIIFAFIPYQRKLSEQI
jgi:hypothetical protein